jgi:hypothetical protein
LNAQSLLARPYISGKLSDSTTTEAGSSVDEKLKGHGPEAMSLFVFLADVLLCRRLFATAVLP